MRVFFRTGLLVLAAGISSLFAATPVEAIGTLTVTDGKIVGSKSTLPAQLRGMSLYWSMSRSARAF